jgi:hypothetical protein
MGMLLMLVSFLSLALFFVVVVVVVVVCDVFSHSLELNLTNGYTLPLFLVAISVLLCGLHVCATHPHVRTRHQRQAGKNTQTGKHHMQTQHMSIHTLDSQLKPLFSLTYFQPMKNRS